MANEKRLIDANALLAELDKFANPMPNKSGYDFLCGIATATTEVEEAPTVDAVEVADPELREAIKLLIEQYEHSKASDYVHNPVAHAFFHTWKKIDERGYGERKYK